MNYEKSMLCKIKNGVACVVGVSPFIFQNKDESTCRVIGP